MNNKSRINMNKALVVGASGATGKLLISDLLSRNIEVIAVVREKSSLKSKFESDPNYHEFFNNISEMSDRELASLLDGCHAVLSCLGHNLTFQGIFGKPRRLVTDTIAKISRAIELLEPDKKTKVILMNTTGNSNRDIPETLSLSQKIIISIIRALLPPHADNEQAADYLRVQIGQNHRFIEWVAVRPDGLIDEPGVTKYTIHPSPTRNPIFNAGVTSRINVANFMTNLATDHQLWEVWKGKMPVIYNDV